jgi:hypothetical protein
MTKSTLSRGRGASSAARPVQDEVDYSADACTQLAAGATSATDQMI